MTLPSVVHAVAPEGGSVLPRQVESVIDRSCQPADFNGKRVLVVVPDATRTAPVGQIFKGLYHRLGSVCEKFDVMIALGTHPPMSREGILRRLEMTEEEKNRDFASVQFFNHAWDDPNALKTIGTISAEEIDELSGGLFAMEVPVQINRMIFDYDALIVIGPVFPHEVVGFSGGNKYFFPGIGGPEILNFFHWLGAVVTNPMIIGNKWTPVRKVVDRAAAFIPLQKMAFCPVVDEKHFYGLYAGTPEAAWDAASDHSAKVHITYKDQAFKTVLSCAPLMYDELWVAGKCMYKLEPVLAEGAELIIYAPHLKEVSEVHGKLIREIGYHCRDYFLKQWDRFKDYPWGVLAHSTHVHGVGTYEDGVERRRVMVTLASQIPPDVCKQINLGYRDPATIDPQDYADREDEGVLLVPKAGERLFHLESKPVWAGG